MDFDVITRNIPYFVNGTIGTIILMVSTIGIAVIVSVPLAFFRDRAPAPVRVVIEIYSWVFRAVPALVVLFFMYYGLPVIGIYLNAWGAAILGLSLTAIAYMIEIIRGGIRSVPAAQWDSARALGLPLTVTVRRIIFPQALRTVTPPLFSNFTLLLKDSTLASLVAVQELTGRAMSLISETYKPVEILLIVTAIYLFLNTLIVMAQSGVERATAARDK